MIKLSYPESTIVDEVTIQRWYADAVVTAKMSEDLEDDEIDALWNRCASADVKVAIKYLEDHGKITVEGEIEELELTEFERSRSGDDPASVLALKVTSTLFSNPDAGFLPVKVVVKGQDRYLQVTGVRVCQGRLALTAVPAESVGDPEVRLERDR